MSCIGLFSMDDDIPMYKALLLGHLVHDAYRQIWDLGIFLTEWYFIDFITRHEGNVIEVTANNTVLLWCGDGIFHLDHNAAIVNIGLVSISQSNCPKIEFK